MNTENFKAALDRIYIQARTDLGPFLDKTNFIEFAKANLKDAKKVDWENDTQIPTKAGAYWIFTETRIQFKKQFGYDPQCKFHYTSDDGSVLELQCVYNGKARNLRGRLRNHLNSKGPSQTTVSLRVNTFKLSQQSSSTKTKVQKNRNSFCRISDNEYFINGITAKNEPLNWYYFVLPCTNGLEELVEKLWRELFNGQKPPLCSK